jgi:hypothetical protein
MLLQTLGQEKCPMLRNLRGQKRNRTPVALRSKWGRARLTRRVFMPYQPGTERCK